MGRRTVLLVVAALIAALGSAMVFVYVRGADTRARASQDPRQVLVASATINAGETLKDAQAAGKIKMGSVPTTNLLAGAVDSTATLQNEVALQTIYPGEQIATSKFGAAGNQDVLTIPNGDVAISVNLTDPGRVAGFVSPGANVVVFLTLPPSDQNKGETRLLLPKVQVIAVGDTTVIPTTTTTNGGAQTTEQLPKTLITLATSQKEAQKVLLSSSIGELSFGLLNDKSKTAPGPGTTPQNLFR